MNILGCNFSSICHDASAAIIVGGKLLAAAEEERFTRHKHDGRPPTSAIEFCLQYTGMSWSDVHFIAFGDKPYYSGKDSFLADMAPAIVENSFAAGRVSYRRLLHKRFLDAYVRGPFPQFNVGLDRTVAEGLKLLRARFGALPRLKYYGHHLGHAAAAYFTSGLDRASVVTLDAMGGPHSASTWNALGARINRIRAEPYDNSLGYFYEDCREYVGFVDFEEGKFMGLAAYGDPTKCAPLVAELIQNDAQPWYRYARKPSESVLGFPRRSDEPVLQPPYVDFAAAAQAALEAAVQRTVRWAIEETNIPTVCLGGGIGLNCSSNGRLLRSGAASSVWIFPAAGDAGLSVGAASLCAAEVGEAPKTILENVYLGPEFTSPQCEAVLAREPQVSYRRSTNVAEDVAPYLAEGQIIGWFQGRMELGPRALGNRSILADPRRVSTRDRVNLLKGREQWRPLAPVVLSEHASEFFQIDTPSPFMLFATQVSRPARNMIPAVVHVDGSARPQTLTPAQNKLLYDLVQAFFTITGVPVLINTSFNAAGEPIVCTPADAVRTFLATKLDLLVIDQWIVTRNAASPRALSLPTAFEPPTSR